MDPISHIKTYKDTSFYLILKAQELGYEIHYLEWPDLFIDNGIAKTKSKLLKVKDQAENYFEFFAQQTIDLSSFDIILMRKDPPFDIRYIYVTQILEMAENLGVKVINKPASLRDCNEKLFATQFAEFGPETLVSADKTKLQTFIKQQQKAVLKPLDAMGGQSIFLVDQNDVNTNVIIDLLTENGEQFVMAQRFIPEVTQGDKRIFLVHGEAIPFALARFPMAGEIRANLAAGGSGKVVPLNERDFAICAALKSTLQEKDLCFVGIDVIGGYLTEINVTSPTGAREIAKHSGIDIAGLLFAEI